MLKGYHNILRAIASKVLVGDRSISVPKANLAIGPGEQLGAVGRQRLSVTPAGLVRQQAVKTLDDTIHLGTGKQFLPSDFPATGYTGEPI